ncbi:TIGR02530 family flagellar biosynthesis protein [Paenibacillus sp. D2_2]|uniref:TIGR02530 family flagellar biosynthesis protein n=1 Tax=Paenibacillus sp. D2_2 TaxID=3073092 RepID=UPI002814C912|nr:TIGR02530 family flagellar biosynthesis protein [Paenibacillus sp. D2_2]WMT39186.1 TIGR02530 family flagellar biosynthesis protein [Paenibacillus sp. D2_2]
MNDPVRIGNLYPGIVHPGSLQQPKNQIGSQSQAQGNSFKELFQDELFRLSNHAVKRLEQRGIELKPEQISKINSAIDSAAAKGAKDSLILMKDMALIVNVQNRTVVTAMDKSSMQDNVFTQIDSAVIIS